MYVGNMEMKPQREPEETEESIEERMKDHQQVLAEVYDQTKNKEPPAPPAASVMAKSGDSSRIQIRDITRLYDI